MNIEHASAFLTILAILAVIVGIIAPILTLVIANRRKPPLPEQIAREYTSREDFNAHVAASERALQNHIDQNDRAHSEIFKTLRAQAVTTQKTQEDIFRTLTDISRDIGRLQGHP